MSRTCVIDWQCYDQIQSSIKFYNGIKFDNESIHISLCVRNSCIAFYLSAIKMASNKNNNNSMATPLDRLCFQVKDILRNYGKQQTAEGTMTAEVITDHLMFIKFFESYSKELHGDRSLKVYDKLIEKEPSIASMTLNSFMAPYIEHKRNSKKVFTEEEIGNLVLNEHLLHQVLKTTHPTSEIFDHTQSLYERLQHDECVLKILEAIYLSDVKLDDVGDIHEYFIQDEAKSKSKMYGQFFTPNEICMKAMELVQPKLKPDGSIPDCLDPAAGSFKFMRNLAKHLSETSGKPYEDILLNHCYGCEIEKKAYRSLQFNIVMETGDISENVYHANSLKYLMYGKDVNDKRMEEVRDYDTTKRYDYIFANPPFGCKTELEMIQRNADDKVDKKTKAIGNFKMKTKNSDGMFLQLIIHLLKDSGEACIVMCGSIFNKDWVALRKYWMETCEIISITVCPKDSFKNTSIESYLIHFKKGGRTDRVEYHHFTDGYIGERSEFDEMYDLSVPRSSIVTEASHSTSYSIADLCEINELKADRKKYEQYKYIEISSIDENGLAQPTTVNKNDLPSRAQLGVKVGDILFGSVRPNLKRHVYVDKEMFADNLIVSTGFFVLTPKHGVDGYFLYNTLLGQDFTSECMVYASKKAMYPSVNREDLSKICVSLPSYELQVCASHKLKTLDHNINITKQKIEADKEYMKILLETETMGCEKVRLGDVCDVKSGKAIAKGKLPEGDVPIWGGGVKPMGCTDKHTHTVGTIVISKDGANAGYVHRLKHDAFLTGSANFITDIKQVTTSDYLYFELKYHKQSSLTDLQGNPTAQPHVYPDQIKSIEIGLPSLDKQQEIGKECLRIYAQIAGNEMTLANCDKQKQQLITSYITSSG